MNAASQTIGFALILIALYGFGRLLWVVTR